MAGSLWAAPPGTRETLPFWAGCLETGAQLGSYEASKMGTWVGGVSSGLQACHVSAPHPSPCPGGGSWPEPVSVLNRGEEVGEREGRRVEAGEGDVVERLAPGSRARWI